MAATARCPSITGSLRCCAQRPFPSVMIATYCAVTLEAAKTESGQDAAASYLEDLLFLALQKGVDLLHRGVGVLLELLLAVVLLVRARIPIFLQLPQVVHHVAADVPDPHPPLLRDAVDDLHELLAALLGQLGDLQADHVPVV